MKNLGKQQIYSDPQSLHTESMTAAPPSPKAYRLRPNKKGCIYASQPNREMFVELGDANDINALRFGNGAARVKESCKTSDIIVCTLEGVVKIPCVHKGSTKCHCVFCEKTVYLEQLHYFVCCEDCLKVYFDNESWTYVSREKRLSIKESYACHVVQNPKYQSCIYGIGSAIKGE